MTKPNMTLAEFNRWTNSTAFKQYKADRGAQKVNAVIRRTRKYLKGNASKSDRQKVESFISRMKGNAAGERKYGSPPVSAKTASLKNWAYDPNK